MALGQQRPNQDCKRDAHQYRCALPPPSKRGTRLKSAPRALDRSLRYLVSVPLTPNNRQNVRYWHKADMLKRWPNVRFEGNNGHDADVMRYLLMTRSGYSQ